MWKPHAITQNIATGIGSIHHPNGETVSAGVDETGDRQVKGWHGFVNLKGKIKYQITILKGKIFCLSSFLFKLISCNISVFYQFIEFLTL
jgi:hypothetical protein